MKLPAGTAFGPESPRDQKRKGPFVLVLAVLGILMLGTFSFFIFKASPDGRVVWLTPAEFRRSTQPDVLKRLKYKIIDLTGPLLRGFIRVRPQIDLDSSLMTLSTAASEATGLGPPAATNSDGVRSWILARDDLQSFQKRLESIPGAAVVSRPRISTANGVQSQLFVGESSLAGNKSIPVGLTVDIIPRVANGSIKLLVSVISTETVTSPKNSSSVIRTNLALLCQALIPNGGGLVVDGGSAKGSGTNYWLIISPTAVDARGKPIKL